MLLFPFLANLAGYLPRTNLIYQLLNAGGAGILAWYGITTESYIFVMLESIWCLAALYALFRRFKGADVAEDAGH